MKKKLLFLSVCLASMQAINAQVFSENFEGVSVTSGYGDLPAGWSNYNVDGLTPHSSLAGMGTAAWKVRNISGIGKVAQSISYYSSPGASNDWMVTPSITIPASGNIFLKYKEYAPDANFPDGYSVYISTTGNTVADFTSPAVLTVSAANSTGLTTKLVNLSAFLGQTVYIAFRNTSNDMYLLLLDDVQVLDLPANDAKLAAIVAPRYGVINTNTNLGLRVTNEGSANITSIIADWNDGTAHSATISGLNIAPGATQLVNHSAPINYSTIEEKIINVTISQVNGGTDANPADNTASTKFNSTSSAPTKGTVIEEGTGTWCGWCPRGAVAMEYMYDNFKSQGFIGIAVHNQDPMTVSAYNAGANFSGYPSSNVDRAILDMDVSQGDFVSAFNARKGLPVPASITASANLNASTLTVPISVGFVTKIATANFRIAAVVVEDGVTGTGSSYAQANYYANNANGAMGGYESLPNPVPASQMVYDHVGRALLGGYSGEANTVPATITDGTTATHTFTYTVPSTSNLQKLSVVALLIDQSNGEIVNAVHVPAGYVSNEEVENALEFTAFPNPTTDILNVNFSSENAKTLKVYDLNGKEVMVKDLAGANNSVSLSVGHLTAGSYLISISGEGATHTKVFIKK